LIAGHPEGMVVERRNERERKLLKGVAAIGFREHGAVCLNLAGVTDFGPRSGTRHGVIPTTTMLGSFGDHSKVGRAGWPEAGGAGDECGCRGHDVRVSTRGRSRMAQKRMVEPPG
jgi:hypothetical protein